MAEHHHIYELKKGDCLINQPIDMQLEVLSRRGVYEDKKVLS